MPPMDEAVLRGLAKWPNVPDVYGWLALDARGQWRLRNPATGEFERIGNQALRECIARNYTHDAHGRWYFQNGPQRVYARLEYTPLVFRLDGDVVVDHCGRRARAPGGAWLDERGALILQTPDGVGVLDDRDLMAASELMADARGAPADSAAEATFIAFSGARMPLRRLARNELAARFHFVPDPRP